jgi:hypothetical protein
MNVSLRLHWIKWKSVSEWIKWKSVSDWIKWKYECQLWGSIPYKINRNVRVNQNENENGGFQTGWKWNENVSFQSE